MPETLGFVVIGDGTGLGMISAEALAESFDIVIGTLDQRFTGDIVNTRLLRRAKCPSQYGLQLYKEERN
jgi:hypothetical protein